jgi:hypothetical protein
MKTRAIHRNIGHRVVERYDIKFGVSLELFVGQVLETRMQPMATPGNPLVEAARNSGSSRILRTSQWQELREKPRAQPVPRILPNARIAAVPHIQEIKVAEAYSHCCQNPFRPKLHAGVPVAPGNARYVLARHARALQSKNACHAGFSEAENKQTNPDAGTYNRTILLRINDRLDEGALRHALNEIVRRHKILRSVIFAGDGVSYQVTAVGMLETVVS